MAALNPHCNTYMYCTCFNVLSHVTVRSMQYFTISTLCVIDPHLNPNGIHSFIFSFFCITNYLLITSVNAGVIVLKSDFIISAGQVLKNIYCFILLDTCYFVWFTYGYPCFDVHQSHGLMLYLLLTFHNHSIVLISFAVGSFPQSL